VLERRSYRGGATVASPCPERANESPTKPLALSSSTRSCPQERDGGRRPVDRRTYCLLDLHEPLVHDAHLGVRRGVRRHRLADPGTRLQPLLAEHVDTLTPADHGCVTQGPGEEQVVRRALLNPDPHARTVDVHRSGQIGVGRDDVHALDHDVRRGERHPVGPGGVHGEEAEVRPPLGHRLQGLARRVEAEQLQRDAQPAGDLTCEVDGHAGRLVRGALGEHRVAEVDRGARHARGGQVVGERAHAVERTGHTGRGTQPT
jgi:hypothetical protein